MPDDATMTAVLQDRYGDDADAVWRVGPTARPEPGDDEALIEVRAAAIDRGTWHLMTGEPYAARLAFGLRAPRHPVPGRDVAGVVIAVGANVTRFAPGDEVYGTANGSLAEFATAPEGRLARKPDGLSFTDAAAVPVSGLTALQGLHDSGHIAAGQGVLITGASGGVGSFAVQIARAAGADVTGVCSTANVDHVTALGASRVIDRTVDDIASAGGGFDLVLDVAGNSPVGELAATLGPGGRLVFVGAEGGRWIGVGRQLGAVMSAPFRRRRMHMLASRERAVDLERLTALFDAGELRSPVADVLPIERAAEAMRRLVEGGVAGKLVLVPQAT